MGQRVVMKAKDTVFAALAECFITIGTRRYNFMQAINLEAKFEKNKTEGKPGKGTRLPAGRAQAAQRSTITHPSSGR